MSGIFHRPLRSSRRERGGKEINSLNEEKYDLPQRPLRLCGEKAIEFTARCA